MRHSWLGLVLLYTAGGACNGSSDLTCLDEIACESLRDCPPSGIDCVIGVCEEGMCEWVNLSSIDELPTDPQSGLPLGKECRP